MMETYSTSIGHSQGRLYVTHVDLMSYDMDNLRLQIICSLDEYSMYTTAPYVPYFGELKLSEKVAST